MGVERSPHESDRQGSSSAAPNHVISFDPFSSTKFEKHELGAAASRPPDGKSAKVSLEFGQTVKSDGPVLASSRSNSPAGIRLGVRPLESASVALTSEITASQRLPVTQKQLANVATGIAIQSLLGQFSSPKVRADFVNKSFGPNINPDLLSLIDDLRWTLMPRWQRGSLTSSSDRRLAAVDHMRKLLAKADEVMVTNNEGDCLTYQEWYNTLEMLATNQYWDRVPADSRCTHIMHSSSDDGEPFPSTPERKVDIKVPRRMTVPLPKNGKHRCTKVEEVVLSSDSSLSDSEASSSDADERIEVRRSRRSDYRDSRSVVTPAPFEMDGRVHLSEFLLTYEDYFSKAFKGNAYDKTHLLSTFISGDLLHVFEIKGGRRIPYKAMKDHLLKYYKKQKIGGRNFWQKQLHSAEIKEGESLEIYGMRLTEVAKQAYPDSSKECARHLRHQFLQALPPRIIEGISNVEGSLKATSGGKRKYLPFSSLVDLAKDLHRSSASVRPKTVMWTSQTQDKSDHKDRSVSSYFGSGDKAIKTSPERDSSRCSHCKRRGHAVANCWRKLGSCLVCGKQDHQIEDCPRYNPRHRFRSQSRVPHRSKPKKALN